ncbi:hypothetical protein PIB30_008741 [Stylosanthes scabra]|uniref:Uncharacterized protein n=1 Tax=Stylosanthes scabra TaxID=79078 RepID=A0ABU6V5N3_9FABA|nr:hypothetical protein [Stylosanthes scabra]
MSAHEMDSSGEEFYSGSEAGRKESSDGSDTSEEGLDKGCDAAEVEPGGPIKPDPLTLCHQKGNIRPSSCKKKG